MPDTTDKEKKQPPGGYDSTPLPSSKGPSYTVKITFHRAQNIPISDYGKRSSDPYILAQINTNLPTRHDHDARLRFRSVTAHHSTEPHFDAVWVVAGVPASGMTLKTRILDEDPDDHDDRLGKVRVDTGPIDENFSIREETYKVKKTGGDVKAYTLRWCSTMIHAQTKLHASLVLSIEVLGRTKEDVGKVYTVNNFWWIHYSPMIGRLAGTKSSDADGVERFEFQANQLQLQGPVPNELYHRYVEFKNFVGGMFQGTGLRGKVLHTALHHQHERIYNFNPKTKHGLLDGPGPDMTLRFLEMVHFDQGSRIFTYVITLDGLFRFTETGKEFGIDLLSKHTMHSDVNIYIAWSGEFLVRRLAHPDESAEDPNQHTHPTEDLPNGPPHKAPPKEPRFYELVIDNDSGTYRPNGDLLPVLKRFLERNLTGLQVLTKSCTDKELDKIKEEQKASKTKEGDRMVYGQGSDSGSISSSDEEELADRARAGGQTEHQAKVEKGVDLLVKPKEVITGLVPGERGREEREAVETEDDNAAS